MILNYKDKYGQIAFINVMLIFAGIMELLPLPLSCYVTWIAFKRIAEDTRQSQFKIEVVMIKLNAFT